MDTAPLEKMVAGKRVTVLGLGLLGRAAGDAEFLAQLGAQVTVTDRKKRDDLLESVQRLEKYPNVTFVLGEHRLSDFEHADMIIKAAGVPLNSPEIAAARSAGVPVYMSTALFARFAAEGGAVITGVTGTRGKSTVTHFIYHTLKHAGKRTHIGGNVRGVSTLAMLPQVEVGDHVVLELDSWQLQGFGAMHISPHVSVFTNLMPDHLNYYPDMDTYFNDKAYIFSSQRAGDTVVAGASIAERIRSLSPASRLVVPKALPTDWVLRIPGEHNRENAALAVEALRALGLSESEIRDGIESFEGVEGRLQLVDVREGVKIYNDNNATTPAATIAALKSLPEGKIILIAGGSDKGLELNDLANEIKKRCKRVELLAGTGTEKIVPLLSDVAVHQSLEEALDAARHEAADGDVILFSPAFASFGMFKNEYDRNDQFLAMVHV